MSAPVVTGTSDVTNLQNYHMQFRAHDTLTMLFQTEVKPSHMSHLIIYLLFERSELEIKRKIRDSIRKDLLQVFTDAELKAEFRLHTAYHFNINDMFNLLLQLTVGEKK